MDVKAFSTWKRALWQISSKSKVSGGWGGVDEKEIYRGTSDSWSNYTDGGPAKRRTELGKDCPITTTSSPPPSSSSTSSQSSTSTFFLTRAKMSLSDLIEEREKAWLSTIKQLIHFCRHQQTKNIDQQKNGNEENKSFLLPRESSQANYLGETKNLNLKTNSEQTGIDWIEAPSDPVTRFDGTTYPWRVVLASSSFFLAKLNTTANIRWQCCHLQDDWGLFSNKFLHNTRQLCDVDNKKNLPWPSLT